jgi:hypothetical protein
MLPLCCYRVSSAVMLLVLFLSQSLTEVHYCSLPSFHYGTVLDVFSLHYGTLTLLDVSSLHYGIVLTVSSLYYGTALILTVFSFSLWYCTYCFFSSLWYCLLYTFIMDYGTEFAVSSLHYSTIILPL